MNLSDALSMKNILAASLLSKKAKTSRTFSFAAGSDAIAVAMAASVPAAVNGVGIGEKPGGGNYIKILLREKSPVSSASLAAYYNVPVTDIKTEVVGAINFKNFQAKHRPPFPGVSVGHYNITAGTLGCFVKGDDSKVYILSNNHVLADSDKGYWGDEILQSGPLDGGNRKKDVIGNLAYIMPLERSKPNPMDAAIAVVQSDIPMDYLLAQNRKITGTKPPANNLKVEKFGRTTGHTKGKITVSNLDLQVDFDGQLVDFEDQFQVKGNNGKMFCDGGDSGSLIMEQDSGIALGLLFAGTGDGTTYATPIDSVLTAFSVKIL